MNRLKEEKSKKVLLLTLEYPPFRGGVANYYYNLAANWPKPDEISVLHNEDKELVDPSAKFFKWRKAKRIIKSVIKNKGVEHLIVGHILPLGTVALFLGLPYTVVIHGMDLEFAKKKLRKRWLAKRILNNAHSIICNSNYVKDLVADFLGQNTNKIFVVNPGVAMIPKTSSQKVSELAKRYCLENNEILLSVCRLVRRKGVDMTLKALPEVLKANPKIRYIIVGDGPDKEYLKTIADDLNIGDRIIFTGLLSDEDRSALLEMSDVFIMPSRNIDGDVEGIGIVYLEAALCGKPVIAGDSGGVSDAVRDGFNGLMVDPENVNSIADAILKLMASQSKREELGRNGRLLVMSDFQWPQKSREVYDIIRAC